MTPKILTYFLCLAISLNATGQYLPEATYHFTNGFVTREFTFKGNKKFEYFFRTCTGESTVSGKYSIKAEKLILTLDKSSKTRLPKPYTLEKISELSDSTILAFKFIDLNDSTGIPNVIVSYKSKLNGKQPGTISDSLGQTTLTIQKSELPQELTISFFQGPERKIYITNTGKYNVIYPVNLELIIPLGADNKLEFLLKEYDFEKIVLRAPEEKRFTTYYIKE